VLEPEIGQMVVVPWFGYEAYFTCTRITHAYDVYNTRIHYTVVAADNAPSASPRTPAAAPTAPRCKQVFNIDTFFLTHTLALLQ
jgi:hypothetical protein